MSIADDVEEILKTNKGRVAQVSALVDYIDGETQSVGYWETGIPGAVCSSAEVAPGVTLYYNGNGSVVAVEIDL